MSNVFFSQKRSPGDKVDSYKETQTISICGLDLLQTHVDMSTKLK